MDQAGSMKLNGPLKTHLKTNKTTDELNDNTISSTSSEEE